MLEDEDTHWKGLAMPHLTGAQEYSENSPQERVHMASPGRQISNMNIIIIVQTYRTVQHREIYSVYRLEDSIRFFVWGHSTFCI